MNKRGQFYLVAGIIIVSVIIGFIAIVNYADRGQTIVVDDMREELKIETQRVLDYDLSHVGETLIDDFGVDYSKHIGSDIKLYFIKGEDPNIDAYEYVNGIKKDVDVLDYASLIIDSVNDKIILTLEGIDYEFDLYEGSIFYFLILQEIKGERFVATG